MPNDRSKADNMNMHLLFIIFGGWVDSKVEDIGGENHKENIRKCRDDRRWMAGD